MGDDKYFTIQVKGTAYRFKPVPSTDFERVAVIQHLSVDSAKTIQVLTRVLANSAGDDAWNKLTDRYIAGELTLRELTVDVFGLLVKRQQAEEKKAKSKGPKGLDVASSTLVPNDAE